MFQPAKLAVSVKKESRLKTLAMILADFGTFLAYFGTLRLPQPFMCFHPGSHWLSHFALECTAKGTNDILTASALKFIGAMNSAGTSEESKNALIKQVQDYLNALGEKNPSFAELLKLARTAGDMPGVLRDLITNIFSLYNLYKENWEATMKVIYELNPEITLEVLSVYNPAYKIFIDENRSINIGPIVQPVIDMVNHFMKSESSYRNKYVFVDVDGVDTWGMTLADPDYFTYFVWSMHPTRLGHTDIATRMLNGIGYAELCDRMCSLFIISSSIFICYYINLYEISLIIRCELRSQHYRISVSLCVCEDCVDIKFVGTSRHLILIFTRHIVLEGSSIHYYT